jgi:ABC-type Fe3+-citrate transport system substrate-binding protein
LAQANKSTLTGEKDLKELNDKITNFDKILAEKSKEMKELMDSHKNKMIEVEKELKKDTQEIQSKK